MADPVTNGNARPSKASSVVLKVVLVVVGISVVTIALTIGFVLLMRS